MTGTVKWFDAAKGYGYIQTEEGNDLFFHYTAIAEKGYRKVDKGQEVEFDVTEGKRGPVAANVVVKK